MALSPLPGRERCLAMPGLRTRDARRYKQLKLFHRANKPHAWKQHLRQPLLDVSTSHITCKAYAGHAKLKTDNSMSSTCGSCVCVCVRVSARARVGAYVSA